MVLKEMTAAMASLPPHMGKGKGHVAFPALSDNMLPTALAHLTLPHLCALCALVLHAKVI